MVGGSVFINGSGFNIDGRGFVLKGLGNRGEAELYFRMGGGY